MKKHKILKIFVVILLIIYLPCAPVLVKSQYGSQPQADISVGKGYAYLWLTRNDSFLYMLFLGIWKYEIQQRTNIMFRDEEGILDKVIIDNLNLTIDGQSYDIEHPGSTIVEMDSGLFNMYGGVGSSGSLSVAIPSIPNEKISFKIEGKAINKHGKKENISLNIKSDIITKTNVIPLFLYFYGQLTQT